jgi:hypothetical protein
VNGDGQQQNRFDRMDRARHWSGYVVAWLVGAVVGWMLKETVGPLPDGVGLAVVAGGLVAAALWRWRTGGEGRQGGPS